MLSKILEAGQYELYNKKLTATINSCIEKGLFPDELKIADVSPIFKKDERP